MVGVMPRYHVVLLWISNTRRRIWTPVYSKLKLHQRHMCSCKPVVWIVANGEHFRLPSRSLIYATKTAKGNHKPEGFSRSYLRGFQLVLLPLFVHQNILPTLG